MNDKGQGAAYRRGVLLGLTMAEIIILVVFLLLLTFAAMLKNEREKHLSALNLVEKHKSTIEKIINAISDQEPAITEELILATERLPEFKRLIEKDKLADENEPLESVLERGLEKLKLEKLAEKPDKEMPIEEQLKQALEEKAGLESELSDIQKQNKNLISQIEDKGRGLVYPSCWYDKDEKPEYIFHINLTNDGIVVFNNTMAHRVEDQAKLPVDKLEFEKLLNIPQFLNQTMPLLTWSQKKDCRFFVRVCDQTAGEQKELYKRLLEAVEGPFYKLIVKPNILEKVAECNPKAASE